MYDLVMEKQDASILPGRLQSAIDLRGISPAELARRSEVDKATISLILSGKRPNTPVTVVAKLARALLVSVDYLVGITDDPEPKALGLGEDVIRLAQTASRLPVLRQRDLVRIAKMFGDAIEETSLEENIDEFKRLVQIAKASGQIETLHEYLIEIFEAADEAADQLKPGDNEDSDDDAIDSEARQH